MLPLCIHYASTMLPLRYCYASIMLMLCFCYASIMFIICFCCASVMLLSLFYRATVMFSLKRNINTIFFYIFLYSHFLKDEYVTKELLIEAMYGSNRRKRIDQVPDCVYLKKWVREVQEAGFVLGKIKKKQPSHQGQVHDPFFRPSYWPWRLRHSAKMVTSIF